MQRIGIIAGSFDPITNGHVALIKQACSLVDELHVVVAVNPNKRCYIENPYHRWQLAAKILRSELPPKICGRIKYDVLTNDLLILFADRIKATHLIRGIRNTNDFVYEHDMQTINSDINGRIDTVYFIPPPHLVAVSSSMVKSLIGIEDWETIVGKYLHPLAIEALKAKYSRTL